MPDADHDTAMTSVPPARAGMASGIMSAQRHRLDRWIRGAWFGAGGLAGRHPRPHLAAVVPDPVERRAVAAAIVGSANPRAHVAEIGPRQPIVHVDPATQAGILAVAERDFVQGIRIALLVAIGLLALVFLAGLKWFPRGGAMLSDAEQEAARLAGSEP
jgi:hypothetical protein